MKIRLLSSPKRGGYADALDRLKQCVCDVDEYLAAKQRHDLEASHMARLKVSLYVPGGVYIRGDDKTSELYAVYGVQCLGGCTERESVFCVLHARVHPGGEIEGTWQKLPLIGSDGFLTPITGDEYCGERYIRYGELIHP